MMTPNSMTGYHSFQLRETQHLYLHSLIKVQYVQITSSESRISKFEVYHTPVFW